jgi:hypothetical protein
MSLRRSAGPDSVFARFQDRYRPLGAARLTTVFFWLFHVSSFYVDTRSWATNGLVLGLFLLPQLSSRLIAGWLYNGAGYSVLIAGLFHSMHNAIVNSTGLVAVVGLPQFEVLVIIDWIVVVGGAMIAAATRGRLGLKRPESNANLNSEGLILGAIICCARRASSFAVRLLGLLRAFGRHGYVVEADWRPSRVVVVADGARQVRSSSNRLRRAGHRLASQCRRSGAVPVSRGRFRTIRQRSASALRSSPQVDPHTRRIASRVLSLGLGAEPSRCSVEAPGPGW